MRILAQTVLGRLVLKQGVENVGAGAQAGLERFGDRFGRGLADLAVRVVQAGEGDVERDRLVLAGEVDPDRRGQLVK